jgi:hypothetical protein
MAQKIGPSYDIQISKKPDGSNRLLFRYCLCPDDVEFESYTKTFVAPEPERNPGDNPLVQAMNIEVLDKFNDLLTGAINWTAFVDGLIAACETRHDIT